MSIFEQLTQATADYDALWGAFRESAQTAVDITSTVAARLADERSRIDERTATITSQSRDPSRPEVVRKLAIQELDRLQGITFAPSEDEAAAFSAALDDARAALRDAIAVRSHLAELFRAADQELKTLRAATLGDQVRDADLAYRHIDSEQKAFDRLGNTGRSNGRT